MNDVKVKPVELELGGKVFQIEFNLNVLAEIQERYSSVTSIAEEIKKLKELKWIVSSLINGSENEEVNEKWVGIQISLNNLNYVVEKVTEAFNQSMPQNEEDGELDDPNFQTE